MNKKIVSIILLGGLSLLLLSCSNSSDNATNPPVSSVAPPPVAAATVFAPRGIYCSCPPTTRSGSHSVMPAVANKDFVRGILIRVEWREIEQNQGQFQWDLLDSELAAARQYGKKVALAIINGHAAPAWLGGAGAQMFNYDLRGSPTSLPVPWDAVYLSAWSNFVAQLGARYKDNLDIALIHITHSTYNGFEMQLPYSPTDQGAWQTVGYSPTRLIDSWKTVVDAFVQAFPTHALDLDVHPIGADPTQDPNQVAREVVAYGNSAAGPRFGVFAAWWSQNNAQTAYPDMFALIQQGANTSFSTVQMVTIFGTAISPELDLAFNSGVRYMEIWNGDILNTAIESSLRATATQL